MKIYLYAIVMIALLIVSKQNKEIKRLSNNVDKTFEGITNIAKIQDSIELVKLQNRIDSLNDIIKNRDKNKTHKQSK